MSTSVTGESSSPRLHDRLESSDVVCDCRRRCHQGEGGRMISGRPIASGYLRTSRYSEDFAARRDFEDDPDHQVFEDLAISPRAKNRIAIRRRSLHDVSGTVKMPR